MNRKIIIDIKTRDRIERQIENSLLANATRVSAGGLASPDTALNRGSEIARRVAQDLMRDYRLVPRK